MTETHTAHWHAVARRHDLRHRPLRIWFQGTPVVLFTGADGPAALTDRCPHRLVELSKGRVMQGEIECPYHGWRFDGTGRCTAIPGHLGACPTYQVKRHNLVEADGVIYLSEGTPDASPYTHCMADHPVICRRVRSVTRSSVIDVAENILDATHTHFTHKGLLRGLSAKRHTVQVEVTGGPDWVEACYTGEDRQDGVISRLMEGTRLKTIGRFKAPGIAELEYWGPNGRVLATTFHLRPGAPGHVDGIGFLVGPDEGLLSRLKALAFPLFFRIALEQDRRVLSSAAQNAALVPGVQPAIGPLDFLRADIAAILDGRRPVAADSPRMVQMTL